MVIAILHDMDFVAESFQRVIAMAHGKVIADGTPQEVFSRHDVLEKPDWSCLMYQRCAKVWDFHRFS